MTEENISFIRLSTGEDIISQILETKVNDRVSYTLISPLKIVYTVSPSQGFLQLALMEWVFGKICDNQEFSIKESDILATGVPTESMIDYYWKTLDNFEEKKNVRAKEKFEESFDELNPDDDMSDDNVQKIMEYLKNTSDKRKLH